MSLNDHDAEAFIATADSRETSPEIMRAIAFFARTLGEAEAIWNGDGERYGLCSVLDIWEHVTGNGLRDADQYVWGASGNRWFEES
jgi:hypothetical protein